MSRVSYLSTPSGTGSRPTTPDPDDDGPVSRRTIERLSPYLDGAAPLNPEPLSLIAVLAGERPAAWLNRPSHLTRGEFDALLDALPVSHRAPPDGGGRAVAADPARFELFPSPDADRDDFDRRMGGFLGYPRDAIEGYLAAEGLTTRLGSALVRRGQVEPAAFAYAKFAPWVRPLSRGNLERQIVDGKRIARRLLAVNARCGTRRIAAAVARVYHAERRRLEGLRHDGVLDGLVGLRRDPIVPDLDGPLRIDALGTRP